MVHESLDLIADTAISVLLEDACIRENFEERVKVRSEALPESQREAFVKAALGWKPRALTTLRDRATEATQLGVIDLQTVYNEAVERACGVGLEAAKQQNGNLATRAQDQTRDERWADFYHEPPRR